MERVIYCSIFCKSKNICNALNVHRWGASYVNCVIPYGGIHAAVGAAVVDGSCGQLSKVQYYGRKADAGNMVLCSKVMQALGTKRPQMAEVLHVEVSFSLGHSAGQQVQVSGRPPSIAQLFPCGPAVP